MHGRPGKVQQRPLITQQLLVKWYFFAPLRNVSGSESYQRQGVRDCV